MKSDYRETCPHCGLTYLEEEVYNYHITMCDKRFEPLERIASDSKSVTVCEVCFNELIKCETNPIIRSAAILFNELIKILRERTKGDVPNS